VAETFSRFLQALQANKGPRDYLQAYLFRAAHNIIADHYRRRPVIEELDESQPDESNTEESARLNLRQRHVRTALRELTDESTTPCQLTGSCFLIERTCAYYGFCAGKHSICALSMYST
jgi:DNA-directed RNA polymerase specialized sigma24 family protein